MAPIVLLFRHLGASGLQLLSSQANHECRVFFLSVRASRLGYAESLERPVLAPIIIPLLSSKRLDGFMRD